MDRLTKAQMEFMNGYVPANIHDIYEDGGIHINPSKKGTFKAQATRMNMGVQEAASHILANKDDYSPTMVKKANFAKNFAKQEGGVAQGNQSNEQMMQMIQMYAQYIAQQLGENPNQVYQELMQQLQQLKPDEQQVAIAQIVEQVQTLQQQSQGQEQGTTQVQDQENPEEQLQEQNMEEPQGQSMAYGGIAKYPYGGMYGQDGFRADSSFAPKSKLNDTLADVNMLSNANYSPFPLLSTMHNDPARFLSGAAGIASVASGFGLGAQALFNNKKNSDAYENYFHNKNNQAQNMIAPNFNPKINTDINAGQKPGLWDKYNPKQDPFKTSYSKPTMSYGGNLPYAQKGKAVGFVEGMGAYQPGYGEFNNGMTEQNPTYNDLRVPYDVNKNKIINNNVNTNKKTLINGEQIASNMLSGLGMLNNALTKNNSQSVSFNTMDNPYVSNPLNAYGDYTTNVQGGANFFQPIKHTYAQDNGSTRISKYGGQQKFQSGGQYKISHDELIQLLRDGAEVEFL